MNKKIERQCPVCGTIYDADPTRLKHGRQTTCSRSCSYELRAAEKKRQTEHKCPVCGKTFLRTPSQVKARHGHTCCSPKCAYQVRQRVVSVPYNRVAVVNYSAAAKKAWETRRRNPKPYPETARRKAAAQAVERIKQGGGVSKFEMKVAEVFRRLGVAVQPSLAVRNSNGTFAAVFDIFIPTRGIVVECHGTYWHGGRWSWDTPTASQVKNLMYEERKTVLARRLGLELRIVWEHEFKRDPTGACLAAIR